MLGVVGTPATNKMNPRNEETLNEEYLESMDHIKISKAMGVIAAQWDEWKKGPLTKPSDIKPAQKELIGWITKYLKQTIK